AMPYGRPADTEFHRHWSKVLAASAITKGKCYACRYCHHKLVYNTGNMRRHLETCEKHLKVLREQIASKNSASNPQRQRKLAIPTLISAQKHEFDLLCARIPLLHGHSFALFECEDMVSLFRKALPAYKRHQDMQLLVLYSTLYICKSKQKLTATYLLQGFSTLLPTKVRTSTKQ